MNGNPDQALNYIGMPLDFKEFAYEKGFDISSKEARELLKRKRREILDELRSKLNETLLKLLEDNEIERDNQEFGSR